MRIGKSLEKISAVTTGLLIAGTIYVSSVFGQGVVNTEERMPEVPKDTIIEEVSIGKNRTIKVGVSGDQTWIAGYLDCGNPELRSIPYLLSIHDHQSPDRDSTVHFDLDRNKFIDKENSTTIQTYLGILNQCE